MPDLILGSVGKTGCKRKDLYEQYHTALPRSMEAYRTKTIFLSHPGHKGTANLFPDGLLSLDLTELPDTDSLFEASGTILQEDRKQLQVLGTKRALFSARMYAMHPGHAPIGCAKWKANRDCRTGAAPKCGSHHGFAGSAAGFSYRPNAGTGFWAGFIPRM